MGHCRMHLRSMKSICSRCLVQCSSWPHAAVTHPSMCKQRRAGAPRSSAVFGAPEGHITQLERPLALPGCDAGVMEAPGILCAAFIVCWAWPRAPRPASLDAECKDAFVCGLACLCMRVLCATLERRFT